MKRSITLLMAAMMIFTLAACGKTEPNKTETSASKESQTQQMQVAKESETTKRESQEVIVFAAASMTETLMEIAELYKEIAPEVNLVFNFDSSGTLKTQICEGADCDLFISAAPKQMDQLDVRSDAEINPDGLDYVDEKSRVNLLENKVVLVTSAAGGADAGIKTFEDLLTDKVSLVCLGNEDVPVGAYSLKILDYLGTSAADLEAAGKVTYASNVKEVTTQVVEGAVDCGIIYATDAYSAGLTPVCEATADMCGQVIYPAAVIKTAKNPLAAQDFLDFLQTKEAGAVFEKVGFTPLS